MYQVDDKVRIRRLKDMQCECEALPSHYTGDLLITRGKGFFRRMTNLCGWQCRIHQVIQVNGRTCYKLVAQNGAHLVYTFEEYMLEKVG